MEHMLVVSCGKCGLPVSHRCAEDGEMFVTVGVETRLARELTLTERAVAIPVVFETYLPDATLEHQRALLKMRKNYQPLRIARLVFVDDPVPGIPPKNHRVQRSHLQEIAATLRAVANHLGAITQGTEADTQQARDATDRVARVVQDAYELLNDSDVRYYISTKQGNQAKLHDVLNRLRQSLPLPR